MRRTLPVPRGGLVPPVSIEGAARSRGDNGLDEPRGSEALLAGRACSASSRRARRGATPACARGQPDAGVLIGSGGGGIDVGEKQHARISSPPAAST